MERMVELGESSQASMSLRIVSTVYAGKICLKLINISAILSGKE